jgi:hypothetical protein
MHGEMVKFTSDENVYTIVQFTHLYCYRRTNDSSEYK